VPRFYGRANLSRLLFLFAYSVSACAPNVTPVPSRPAATQGAPATMTVAPPTDTPTATATPDPTATFASTDTPLPTSTTKATATAQPSTPTRTPTRRAPTPATAPPPAAFHKTKLIAISQGVLTMGTPRRERGDPDEKPQHLVTVYPYSIERFEVTNAQYQACVAARSCPPLTRSSSFTRSSYYVNPAFATYPVINVTWFGADAYCKWIGRRLPNEAEWERAARGVNNWRYTFTNILGMPFEWNAIYHGSPLSFCEASCPLQNFWGTVNDGFADTAPVGTFGYDYSQGFGIQDMAGNVSEWVSNWYDPNAYTDGNDVNGPAAPTGVKVYRGGSWADPPMRNADRNSLAPDMSSDRVGFRCAR
jgi:formylglycine-generating enzyme required for sulfatase activity